MLDIEKIREFLPHRYPMLLVDRILEMEPGVRAIGLKNVTINEEYFQGHFPGQAIMPGVLLLEAMAQVGGVLLLSVHGSEKKLALIAGIENARFRKPVVPGDALITEAVVGRVRKNIGKIDLTGRVDGEVVVSCELTFALVDRRTYEHPVRTSPEQGGEA
jgi:3-hydroxyacyl-[acyl-carrier-protein] dehydratase